MTSPKLRILERQLNIQRQPEKTPVPTDHGLGFAIEKLIEDAVQERVQEALQQQQVKQSPHTRRLMESFNAPASPPPTPRPRAPIPLDAQIERDGAGKARAININGQRFLAQRDAAGLLVRVVSADQAAEVRYDGRPVKPAPLNDPTSDAGPKRAADPTQYQPAKPR